MANWADDEVSDDERDIGNTPEEIQQDRLMRQTERSRGDAPARERRDLPGGRSSDRGGNRNYEQRGGGRDRDDRRRDGGDRQERAPRPKATEADIPKVGPFKIYCGNLNFRTNAQGLAEHFISNGCTVTDVIIAEEDSGRSRGFGHVEFETRDDLIRALDGDGSELDARVIRVDVDRQGQRRNEGRNGGFDRDRRQYQEPTAADTVDEWGRGAQKSLPNNKNNSNNDRSSPRAGGDRQQRRPREQGPTSSDGDPIFANRSNERKKLDLAPRSAPLEAVAAPSGAAPTSIFGDAKPRDVPYDAKSDGPKRNKNNNNKDKNTTNKKKEVLTAKQKADDEKLALRDPRAERAEMAAKNAAKAANSKGPKKVAPKSKVRFMLYLDNIYQQRLLILYIYRMNE